MKIWMRFTLLWLNNRWSNIASWDGGAEARPNAICSLMSRSLSRWSLDLLKVDGIIQFMKLGLKITRITKYISCSTVQVTHKTIYTNRQIGKRPSRSWRGVTYVLVAFLTGWELRHQWWQFFFREGGEGEGGSFFLPRLFTWSSPPTQSSPPFCADVHLSRDSTRAFSDRIKLRENRGLWTVYSCRDDESQF